MDNEQETTAEPKPMRESIEEMNKKFDALFSKDKKKLKEFKVPGKIKRKWKANLKKNRVACLVLGRNARAVFEYKEITDEMFYHEGIPREYNQAFLYYLNGKIPLVVFPEWSQRPIGTKDYIEAATVHKSLVDAETFIIKAMEKREFDTNKMGFSWNWKTVLLIVAMLGVGVWVMFGGSFG